MNSNSVLKEVERKLEAETKNCTEYGSDNENGVENVEVEINEVTGDDDSEVFLSVTDSTVKIESRKISLPKRDENIASEDASQDEDSDEVSASNNTEIQTEHSEDKKGKKPYYRRVSSERYPCSKCDKAFRFLHEMQSHKREHANMGRTRKPRTCPICLKTFSKHYSLKTHMLKKHMGVNLNPAVMLTQEEELNTQEEQLHIQQENLYPPEEIFLTEPDTLNNIEDYHYMHEENLEENILNNQEDNLPKLKTRFPCHLCHKSFSDKKYFRKHLLYHENDQRFVCEVCLQNFTTKSHLTRHIKAQKCVRHVPKEPIVHEEKKVLKKRLKKERVTGWKVEVDHKEPVRKHDNLLCTICSIEFSTKYFLTKHMLIHEKDESLICTICSEECTTKYFLKKHMLIHEKRKYSCTKCSLEFKVKYELDKHNKNNHLEEEVPKVKEI